MTQGPYCFSRGSIPVFHRNHIYQRVIFTGGGGGGSGPILDPFMPVHQDKHLELSLHVIYQFNYSLDTRIINFRSASIINFIRVHV